MALPFQKGLEKYKNIDEDELLGKLSEEELKQLENVLDDLDPEVCSPGAGCFISAQEKGGERLSSALAEVLQPQSTVLCSSPLLLSHFYKFTVSPRATTVRNL